MADLALALATLAFFVLAVALRPRPRPVLGGHMSLDHVLGIGVAALLAAYLVYALLRPERF